MNETKKPSNKYQKVKVDRRVGRQNGRQKESGFRPGLSGNPLGRPRVSDDLRQMRRSSLERAVTLMHKRIHDEAYIDSLKPMEFISMLEVVFDRCGLPKVTREEVEVEAGSELLDTVRLMLEEARKANVIPVVPIPPIQPAVEIPTPCDLPRIPGITE